MCWRSRAWEDSVDLLSTSCCRHVVTGPNPHVNHMGPQELSQERQREEREREKRDSEKREREREREKRERETERDREREREGERVRE